MSKKISQLFFIFVLLVGGFLFVQPKSADASGWLAGWSDRKEITISNTNVDADLANFPISVNIAESGGGSTNIGHNVTDTTNGYDVRFTDSDGTTLLSYERESFSVASNNLTANFWVKIPSITHASGAIIYVYYGNSSANTDWTAATSVITSCTTITNAQCVWKEGSSQNFSAVYHLKETGSGSASDYKDSTANSNNGGQASAEPTATSTTQTGGGQSFNGSTNYISLPNAASIKPVLPVTVSAFVKSSNVGAFGGILMNDNYNQAISGTYYGIEMDQSNAGKLRVAYGDGLGGTSANRRNKFGVTALSVNTWNHVAAVIQGATNMQIYLNGTDDGGTYSGTGGTLGYSSAQGRIGEMDSNLRFAGVMGELRISKVARPAEWIKFESHNISDTGNNLTFAAQENNGLSSNVSSIYKNSTGNQIILTGTNTSWAAGTPGTPTFTISGGTGTSITAQTVTDSTHATITVSAGSSTGTLTITDPSTGATATVDVIALSTADLITSFDFTSLSVTGTINNTNHTVALTVPHGTSVTSLTPTITVSAGATISPTSGTAEDFTNPQTYTVTAQDGVTQQAYTVTVTVAPIFDPSQISGMQIWLRADQGLYKDAGKTQPAIANGDSIATWADQSGNGRDATATTKPTLTACSNCNSVNFTGAPYMTSTWGVLTGNSARSIAINFTLGSGISQSLLTWGSAANGALSSIYLNSAGHLGFGGYSSPSLVDLYDTSQTYNDGSPHVLIATFDGTTLKVYIDGSLKGTLTTTLNTSSSNLFIGDWPDGTKLYNGSINEIDIYDHALSDADRANLTTYLTNKWVSSSSGLTPPVDLTGVVPVIIDSAMSTDIGSPPMWPIVAALAQQGKAKLLASICDTSDPYCAPTTKILDAWWGYSTSTVPVGAYQGSAFPGDSSRYTQQATNLFGVSGDTRANYPSALTVYRQTLAAAANNSVVIIYAGYLQNLQDLLQSPADGISSLTGLQLVTQKVRRLVVMGGEYPSGSEHNFNLNSTVATSTAYVMSNWPTEIVVDGYTFGATVFTKPSSSRNTTTDPLAEMWSLNPGGYLNAQGERESWDPLNALYAIDGLSTNFTAAGISGINTVNPTTGANVWSCPGGGNVTYLGKAASNSALAITLNALIDTTPIIISSISHGTPSSTGTTVTWTTNGTATVTGGNWVSASINTNSEVDYGLTSSYTASSSDASVVSSHSVSLSGLSPNTTYHYRVKSTYSDGSYAVSDDQTFTTAPAPTYTIGGTISGLTGTVVLQNNGGDNYSTSTNGSFVFATSLNNSASYAVTVSSQPTNQTCTVGSGTGTVSSANVTSVTVTCVSTLTAITSFNFASPAVTGTVDNTAHTVALTVPFGTSVTSLTPTIVLATGATISPTSGTAQNFTSPVTYTVTAQDGTTHQAYAVTVTVALNTAKALTVFDFNALTPAVGGSVNDGAKTVTLTVPFGTVLTNLIPTITINGSSVSPASGIAGNFTTPQTYRVTAADSSHQDYVVTVNVAANTAKAITVFDFNGLSPAVVGTIDETGKTIALTVPYGTTVTALVPTITINGSSVSPASLVAQSFSTPATYTVTAANASTQPYIVTVTVAPIGTHTITASAGANGSISPSGSVSVNNGSDQAFTITPNSGYHIDTVTADGGAVSATSPYTFTNVTADHTISAIFAADVVVSHSGGGGMIIGWNNLPITPAGGFKIFVNSGVSTTTNRIVNLNFNAGADVKKMAISLTGDFADASQENYSPTKQIDLCSKFGVIKNPTCPNGKYTIYTKFYTISGIASPVITSSITLTTGVTTSTKYNFTRNLSLHATGADVKALQQFLNANNFVIAKTGAGSPGKETNLFGSLTYKALVKFQKSIGWSGTGFFGPMTREYIKNK